jgi:hypothetical protein
MSSIIKKGMWWVASEMVGSFIGLFSVAAVEGGERFADAVHGHFVCISSTPPFAL